MTDLFLLDTDATNDVADISSTLSIFDEYLLHTENNDIMHDVCFGRRSLDLAMLQDPGTLIKYCTVWALNTFTPPLMCLFQEDVSDRGRCFKALIDIQFAYNKLVAQAQAECNQLHAQAYASIMERLD